jgi:uncharacterized damage-inducible protein DinB
MITPLYMRCLAAYNSEMNRRLYAAAARLPDALRREDGGLYWGSLHATLNHLLWGDEMWMSRFDGWERPEPSLKESGKMIYSFADLAASRAVADRRIEIWANGLTQDDLAGELVWFSGATQTERKALKSLLYVHFFNHQTHHRGQATTMITRHGEDVGDTDLFLVVPEEIYSPL